MEKKKGRVIAPFSSGLMRERSTEYKATNDIKWNSEVNRQTYMIAMMTITAISDIHQPGRY